MASTLADSPVSTTRPDDSDALNATAALEDRVPDALKLSQRTAIMVLVLGLIYGYFCLKPLWHTDIWGHLAYGKLIWSTGTLPATEPTMPLARGVPFVDTAWLTEVASFLTIRGLGIAGIKGLSALLIAFMAGLMLHRTFQRTRSVVFGMLGLLLFLWLDWAPLAVVRPQLAGLVCFLVIVHRTTSPRITRFDWFLVPAVFVVWANLHPSFPIGLGWLAALTLGRGIDLVRRTGTLRSLTHDIVIRRWLLWTELAAVAVLVNPYGLGLWAEIFSVADHPNLESLTEWQPLDLRSTPGYVFLASVVSLVFLYRWTPRRVAAWEPLVLCGLGLSCFWSARFIVWWAPVAAYLTAVHLHAALRAFSPWRALPIPSPRTGKWSVVAVGLAWFFLAVSPLGMRVLHGTEPRADVALSDQTPLGAIEYLRKNPPQGQVFNIYEWGDFLYWAGPPGVKIFVNSHAHLVPRDVWLHYLQVIEQSAGWEEILDRYSVNTVLLDVQYREPLVRRLKDDGRWKVSYEDNRAVVFSRKKPL